MRIGNGTSVGLATVGEWVVGAILAGFFAWRGSGADFGDTTTWVTGLAAAAVAVESALRRSWAAKNGA